MPCCWYGKCQSFQRCHIKKKTFWGNNSPCYTTHLCQPILNQAPKIGCPGKTEARKRRLASERPHLQFCDDLRRAVEAIRQLFVWTQRVVDLPAPRVTCWQTAAQRKHKVPKTTGHQAPLPGKPQTVCNAGALSARCGRHAMNDTTRKVMSSRKTDSFSKSWHSSASWPSWTAKLPAQEGRGEERRGEEEESSFDKI